MTYTISKEFAFCAAHVLCGLPADHPCSREHAHNYRVRVTISRETLDETGFVVDFRALAPFRDWIDATLDHRHLNSVSQNLAAHPTSENLARFLHDVFTELIPVPGECVVTMAVSETPTAWGQYTP